MKLDLKDAYLMVPVWKAHQKFLRFLWKGSLMEFACLPFGLATATRVFTKLMKPVVALLRQMGIHSDYLLRQYPHHGKFKGTYSSSFPRSLSIKPSGEPGFIVNYLKSQLVPSKQLELIGHLVDSETLSLSLPGEKLRKIRKKCQNLLDAQSPTTESYQSS